VITLSKEDAPTASTGEGLTWLAGAAISITGGILLFEWLSKYLSKPVFAVIVVLTGLGIMKLAVESAKSEDESKTNADSDGE